MLSGRVMAITMHVPRMRQECEDEVQYFYTNCVLLFVFVFLSRSLRSTRKRITKKTRAKDSLGESSVRFCSDQTIEQRTSGVL